MADPDRWVALQVENQRLRDENRQLKKWVRYLESSTFGMAEGLAGGLKAWVEDLKKMSPLANGVDEPAVDPQ